MIDNSLKKLGTTLGILPGEGRQVVILGGLFALNVFALLLGRTVRDAVFLNAGLQDYLPVMYVAVAGIVVGSTLVIRKISGHLAPVQLAVRTNFFFAASFVFLYAGVNAGGTVEKVFVFALYLWVEVLTSILILQFWVITNTRFNPRQAKRLYSLITAGQVFGNLACGAVAGLFAHSLGTKNLLWVLMASLLASVFMIRMAGAHGAESATTGKGALTTRSRKEPPLFQSYILSIGMLTVLTYLTTSLVDFQFKVVARSQYSADDLTRFFGIFYGAVGSIAFFLQVFFTNRIVRRIGLFGTLAVMPLGFVLLGAFWIMAPVLMVTRLVLTYVSPGLKFNENLFRYTLNDPLVQLLFIPLPAQTKVRVQSLIGGILKPVAMGGAGLFMLALRWLFVDTGQMNLILLPVSVSILIASLLWMILLLRVRNQYVAILAQTTESFRRLSVTVSEHFTPDRAVPAITRILSHGTPSARATALDLAEQYDIPVPVPALIEQCVFEPLQSGSRATALWLMARDGNADQAPEPLTAQTDPQVSETWLIVRLARGEVLTDAEQQQLIRAPDSRTILRLLALLSAAHERVQPAAARWLLPRALDAAADLLSHNPPPPVVRFRQILQLIGAAYAVDQAEQQVRNLRLGGSAAKSARCFLQRLCEIAIETEALRAQLAEDPRWVDLLHGLLPFDIGIARLALALLLCTPSALNDSGPLLASPDLAAIIQQTWQSVATPAAVRSRLQAIPEDPIVCEWLSRPHPKEAPPAAMAVTMRRMTEIWLGECELLASVYVQTPLLQRTLEECILRRLALLVRMVGWQSGHKSLSILAVPATLQSRSRRTNVAELVDQLWDHPSKNRLIKMLEREFLSHPIADLNAQSVSWDRLPFSTTESRIRSIGCLQLGIDCEPMEDPVNIVEKVLALSSVDLFTHLPIQELERIAEIAETISYNAEDSIIVDGTEGNSLYLLTDGTVEVRKHGKHLATLKGGVCFGEMSLLDDQPRSADVVATTPVSCLHIDRDEFAILLLDQPVISRSIMTVLTGRLRAANEQTRS